MECHEGGRDEGGPALRFQALIYPVCDSALNTPSYSDNGRGYGLTPESMKRYWELSLDGADGRTGVGAGVPEV